MSTETLRRSRRSIATFAALAFLACLAAPGCSDESNDSPPADAGTQDDSGSANTNTGGADAGDTDAADNAAANAATNAAVGPAADGELDLTVTLGDETATLERAYYGVTSPRDSNTERWELYVEAYAGGADGCPTENSPTPDQTLIIAGVAFPDDNVTTTDADGLSVSLLDFSGRLSTAPVESSRGEETTMLGWTVCRECPNLPDYFVYFEIDAPFTTETASADGEVTGRVLATHCPSLDSL
jgi:hypothetical protein